MVSYFLTEENLIGSIGSAILQLKQVKEGRIETVDTAFLNKLMDFFEKANMEDYKDLLYDKYFIVSEDFLGNLHKEFKNNEVIKNIDFANIKNSISGLQTNKETIDELKNKLKSVATILLKNRSYHQTHL